MEGSSDGLPPGWSTANGVVAPGGRVGDFAARGQTVRGLCRSRGCTGKVELDPQTLCQGGLTTLGMNQVQQLWKCQRLDGCGLEFHADAPVFPLRLQPFVGRPNIRVRLRCRGSGCRFFRLYRVEQMIAGLERRSQGGPQTEVAALGPLMTSACPVCKRVNWTAEVLHVSTDTMGWKALGERSFDDHRPD